MNANERLYLTAEGKAQILKAEWFDREREIDDILNEMGDGNYGSKWSMLSPNWEAQMALREDLQNARKKRNEAGRKYYEITGEYLDEIPF